MFFFLFFFTVCPLLVCVRAVKGLLCGMSMLEIMVTQDIFIYWGIMCMVDSEVLTKLHVSQIHHTFQVLFTMLH